jgi:hypothetical protein
MQSNDTNNQTSVQPNSRWNTMRAKARHAWVWLVHGGVDPAFDKAARHLYFKEVQSQMTAWEAFKSGANPSTLSAHSALFFALRTRKLIKFSVYHAEELNDHHTDLLRDLYRRVYAIKKVRKAIILSKLPLQFQQSNCDVHEIESFRLLGSLAHESLKRCA